MNKTFKSFIVYKAISPSNKIYIGITCETLESRKSKHLYTSKRTKTKFNNAINKYGIHNFIWEILEHNLTKSQAIEKEKYYINEFNSYNSGYNSTFGGDGAWGVKWKTEAIQKQIELRKQKYYFKGSEFCKTQSEILKKYYQNNPDKLEKARINARNLNKNKTPEQKAYIKMRAASREAKIKRLATRGCKPFNCYDIVKKQYIGTWIIKAECARHLGISNGKITSCLNNYRNKTKNYIFKLVDDPSVKGQEFNENWLNFKRFLKK